MVNLKKWMAKVSEKLAVLNSGYQHKPMNKSVAKATQETVGTVTLTKGLWVVVSYMKISNAGNSVYNNSIDGQVARQSEINGGGNVNVRFYQVASESQTVNIYAYVTSFATTVTGDVWAIKLGGGNKLPYPLNRIAQILLWRKEVGVC